MAYHSYPRPAQPTNPSHAHSAYHVPGGGGGGGGGDHGPPPSTLAAQLVETLPASTRSSRPDETTELKRLFSLIEGVKNNPDSVKTPQDRLDHNHVIVYVCGVVVLGSLKWDDPFADLAQLRTEALKAVNILKATIKETPAVLKVTTDGRAFLFRGQEPLWLWIFPKVLGLLGHSKCLAVSTVIVDFFDYVLSLTLTHGPLWDLGPALMDYFRTNFAGQ